jgi:hypothetical protein
LTRCCGGRPARKLGLDFFRWLPERRVRLDRTTLRDTQGIREKFNRYSELASDIYIAKQMAWCYSAPAQRHAGREPMIRDHSFGGEHLPMPIFARVWKR